MRTTIAVMAPLAVVSLAGRTEAQVDRYDALATSPMVENRPTPETARLLKDELLFQRATQTYLWQAAIDKSGKPDDIEKMP
jgi:hypothetical protein